MQGRIIANGAAAEVEDNHLGRIARTDYDQTDRPCQSELKETATGKVLYRTLLKYDKFSNLEQFTEKTGNEIHTSKYAYDRDNRVTEIQYDGAAQKVSYTYDDLGRVTSRTAECGNTAGKLTSTYAYVDGAYGTNSTTPLVKKITQNGISFEYTYDSRGNIISEKRGNLTTTYAYDALGQLIRVNDPHENATWAYNYDRGGNILSKVKYAYTTGTLGTAVETIPYTYGDANWKDKLTAYNGTAITYDAIGNPLNDGNWTYEWAVGRQLKKMSKPNKEIEFKYDFNGLRTQKIVTENGVTTTTNYLLHGKLVTHMTVGNDNLHFFYDNSSRLAKVDFNGTIYTYLHNLQGDIVGILDNNGNLVVEYKYDAWGKLLSTTGSLADTLGVRNPFGYRGYVYDEETGGYYLRSRYYNPAVGRFTNADGLVGRRGDILSHNIYCYCDNKPILCVDLTGTGKTYVFYYYFPETTSSLKEEAMNSPYFDATDEDAVSMIPIKTAEDFINAWNAMEGEIDEVYLYLHGAAGHFLLANGRIGFDDVSEYSIDDLNEKIINGTLYDFACYGAAKKGGKTVAGVLAEKTQATVIACDVGVSYRFEQDWLGWYFGNTYHARTRTMSLYQPHWFRFTYNKKKQNVRKMKLHIWRVAKGLIY